MLSKFSQSVTVKTKTVPFNDLCRGDCFTFPRDIGFGQIWIGFHVFCKIDDRTAADLYGGILRNNMQADDLILEVRFGLIEKPKGEQIDD